MSTWAASTLPGVGAMLALLWCEATLAHHSASVFDTRTLIELRGEIVSFKLRSPHASFVINAQEYIDDQPIGEVERWEIESESVPVLRSLGIDADTFEAGDTVTMKVARHRDHDFKFAHSYAIFDAFGEYVMRSSDRLYSPSVREAALEQDEAAAVPRVTGSTGLAGRWQQPLTLFDGDDPGLPLNDAGMAAWRSYDPKQSPANDCEPINIPDIFFSAFFLFEIRIDDDRAVLHNEYYDVVRTVPLKGTWAVADARGAFGTVKGRIDGKTLIVDSRDFPASKWGLGIEEAHRADIPSSTMKTVNERFSVTPDGGTLIYEYKLTDPKYLTRPHSGRVELTRAPDDAPFHAFECDRQSASMWSRERGESPLSAE